MTSPSKRVADSAVELHHFMLPEHANLLGNVHGGIIMKMVDEAGALCAIRHAQRPAVTVTIDSMTFHDPVRVGDVLCLHAHLNYVGRTSMEVAIEVIAEDPIHGTKTHTNSALAVYVALDDRGHPTAVPALKLTTDAEHANWEAGKARQALRRGKNPSP
jgi:acyl-CoA hydrolase